ncbi:hypothetical protein ACLB1E_31300 [Escherichia coli]
MPDAPLTRLIRPTGVLNCRSDKTHGVASDKPMPDASLTRLIRPTG